MEVSKLMDIMPKASMLMHGLGLGIRSLHQKRRLHTVNKLMCIVDKRFFSIVGRRERGLIPYLTVEGMSYIHTAVSRDALNENVSLVEMYRGEMHRHMYTLYMFARRLAFVYKLSPAKPISYALAMP